MYAFQTSCKLKQSNKSKVHSTLPQIWVLTRHQYGIFAFVSQTSFRGKTSGSVAKCRLFSQAKSLYHLSVSQGKQNHEESAELSHSRRELQVFCVASFVGNMTKSGLGDDLANSVLGISVVNVKP